MTVHLVGVGPGDADLMTVRAFRLLGRAEVVVHDRLIGDEVLSWVNPAATLIDVGKTPGRPSIGQDDIDQLLVDLGRRHECVVRVKGGDPYVFGRGIEEARRCLDAGVAVEVVPGISSSVAGPMAAGISVTGRGASSGVCIVSAVQDDDSPPVDWAALARSGLTVVVLMGARRARSVAGALLDGGLSPATPAAAVTNAQRPEQTVWSGRLDELGIEPVAAPSVLVIGRVADPARVVATVPLPTLAAV